MFSPQIKCPNISFYKNNCGLVVSTSGVVKSYIITKIMVTKLIFVTKQLFFKQMYGNMLTVSQSLRLSNNTNMYIVIQLFG